MKDLITVVRKENYYNPRLLRKMSCSLQKNKRYWTDGHNTAVSCTNARALEIHQYWTVPRQTQRITTPSFAQIWLLQYTSIISEERKVSWSWQHPTALLTICNKTWQTGEWLIPWTQSLVITLPKKDNCSMPELLNDQPRQLIQQSYAVDHKEGIEAANRENYHWSRGRLQSRKEHHRADHQPKNPLWETSPAPARPRPCLHKLREGFDRVWHAILWAAMNNTTSAPTLSKWSNTFMTRPPVQYPSVAAWETFSEKKIESDRDVYTHPPSSTYFWKGSQQTSLKIIKALSALEAEQSPISALLITLIAQQERKKHWQN